MANAPRRFAPPRLQTRQPRDYHRWYALPLWKGRHGLRSQQLERQPLCEECLRAGRTKSANEVDHIQPHRGQWELFCNPANHQSLCKPCHSAKTRRGE